MMGGDDTQPHRWRVGELCEHIFWGRGIVVERGTRELPGMVKVQFDACVTPSGHAFALRVNSGKLRVVAPKERLAIS